MGRGCHHRPAAHHGVAGPLPGRPGPASPPTTQRRRIRSTRRSRKAQERRRQGQPGRGAFRPAFQDLGGRGRLDTFFGEWDIGGDGELLVPIEVLLTDVPPPGWFQLGGKKDVPKDACYVARYGDRYAWVTPDGMPGLARFT